MKRLMTFLAIFGLAASFVVAGCDSEDNKTYDVPISWTIGGAELCSALVTPTETVEFDNVTITVYKNEGDEDAMDGPFTVPCSDFNTAIPRLDRGNYWVLVEAWGEYDDMELPLYSEAKAVKAPAQDDDGYTFVLVQSKAKIEVTWDFEIGMCGANDVEDVQIGMVEEEIPCDDGVYTIEDLSGFQSYTVEVEGLDSDGETVLSGSEENIFLLPGQLYESIVILE